MFLLVLALPFSVATTDPSWPACADMSALQRAAKLGQLTVQQRSCLDQRTLADQRPIDRTKAIELLLTDARSRGDRSSWMNLRVRWLKTSAGSLESVPSTVQTLQGRVRKTDMLAFIDRSLAANPGTTTAHIPVLHSRFDLLIDIAEQSQPMARLTWRARARETARTWASTARAIGDQTQEKKAFEACVDVGGQREWCAS